MIHFPFWACFTVFLNHLRVSQFPDISVLLCVSDDLNHETDSSDMQESAHPAQYGIIIIILSCVCAVSVSVTIICSSLYCSRLQGENFQLEDKHLQCPLHHTRFFTCLYTHMQNQCVQQIHYVLWKTVKWIRCLSSVFVFIFSDKCFSSWDSSDKVPDTYMMKAYRN